MGWNTSMIILNDAIHDISRDKEFGKKVCDAILSCYSGQENVDIITTGYYVNGATVIESHHADASILIAVGGNCATVLTSVLDSKHHTEETQVKLLRKLADKLGYTISRKRKK